MANVVTNPTANQTIQSFDLLPASGNTSQSLGISSAPWVAYLTGATLVGATDISQLNNVIVIDAIALVAAGSDIGKAVNTAYNAMTRPGAIYIPAGNYTLSTGITLNNATNEIKCHLFGEPGATLITTSSSFTGTALLLDWSPNMTDSQNSAPTVIFGLDFISGNKQQGIGLELAGRNGISNVLVQSCKFLSFNIGVDYGTQVTGAFQSYLTVLDMCNVSGNATGIAYGVSGGTQENNRCINSAIFNNILGFSFNAAGDYYIDKCSIDYNIQGINVSHSIALGIFFTLVVRDCHIEYKGTTGTVNTIGTAVTLVSGSNFNTSWDGAIVINGISYTISSVNSSTSITLTTSAGAQTGVSYDFGSDLDHFYFGGGSITLDGDLFMDQNSEGTIAEAINVLGYNSGNDQTNFCMQNCNLRTAGVTITNWVAATTTNCNIYMMNNYGDGFTNKCNMLLGTIFNGNFFMVDNQDTTGPSMYWRSQPGHLISFNASTGTTMVITVGGKTFTFDFNNNLTLGGLALTTLTLPTITSGVALSANTGNGNGVSVGMAAKSKGTGGGPATPGTVVGWLEISVGGSPAWIPYCQ